METIIYVMIGYLIGSIPFALVVGKVFYKTDIRKQGSGNLGGTNAGRILGKKAGIAVSVLDVLKAALAIFICTLLAKNVFEGNAQPAYAGFGALIGHCYPIFANFKGGKAVSVGFGLLLATVPMIFAVTLLIWLVCLKFTKMVSLSSLIAFVFATIICIYLNQFNYLTIIVGFATVLMFVRHRENITRIMAGTERKVTWI